MKKALVLSFLVLFSLSAWAQEGTMMKSEKPAADGAMMKGDAMMKAEDSMMKAEGMADSSAFDLRGLGMQVTAFTSEAAAQALAKKSTVVYYFAATWCPDCQATYADLKANYAKIPKDVTLVVVNYDKSADLKKKYGITMQHTFVVLGGMGEKKKVWAGSSTVAEIVKNAKSM